MSAAPTTIAAAGGEPEVTVNGGNLIRYTCRFFLWKPEGQTWPGTNDRFKKIRDVTFNLDHPPTDTFSLGPAPDLRNLALTWDIDMKVPGGGGPLQYSISVEITQDGNLAMNPTWLKQGQINNTEAVADDTELRVSP
jgi:hypothetical protein